MAHTLPDPGENRVIVELPELEGGDLIAVAEVIRQEGFRLWALPIERAEQLPELLTVFGRRAQIGIFGVTSIGQLDEVRIVPAFWASPVLLTELPDAADGVPVILGGLTPSELHAGLAAGAAGVQVIPAEAFGSGYSRALPTLLDPDKLIAAGPLAHYQAQSWLDSGVAAVWPAGLVSQDLVTGDNLSDLRALLQRWQFGV